MGDGPTRPSDDEVEAFVSSRGSLLDDLARMMTVAAESALHDHEIIQLRKSLAAEYPYLIAMRMQTFHDFETVLTTIVARRLAAEDPALGAKPMQLESRAQLVTKVAVATMHHAWSCWVAEPNAAGSLVDRLHASFRELAEVVGELAPR
ncbi:MAG: hypothetical protein ABJA11_06575 [Pseudolysinimonas sp.]